MLPAAGGGEERRGPAAELCVALRVLRSGALRAVLEGFPMPEIWMKALISKNRVRIPRVRALLAVLQESMGRDTALGEG